MKQSLKKSTKKTTKSAQESITIGMDLGDKASRYCVLNGTGEVTEEGSVPTSKKGMMGMFGALRRCGIAMEVGGRSPWVSRLPIALGHEAIVANARQVKLISTSSRRNDRLDARQASEHARMDPALLRIFSAPFPFPPKGKAGAGGFPPRRKNGGPPPRKRASPLARSPKKDRASEDFC